MVSSSQRSLIACAIGTILVAGCADEAKPAPAVAQELSTLNLKLRVSLAARRAFITIRNDSPSVVILSPRLDFLVVYVERSKGAVPITNNGFDANMMALSGFDCVRLSPGDSYSTTRELDFRMSGHVNTGAAVVAVLHPIGLREFDIESQKRAKHYSKDFLGTEVRSPTETIRD